MVWCLDDIFSEQCHDRKHKYDICGHMHMEAKAMDVLSWIVSMNMQTKSVIDSIIASFTMPSLIIVLQPGVMFVRTGVGPGMYEVDWVTMAFMWTKSTHFAAKQCNTAMLSGTTQKGLQLMIWHWDNKYIYFLENILLWKKTTYDICGLTSCHVCKFW